MNSKPIYSLVLFPFILALLFCSAKCDVDKDKEKCADQLVGLATCLPYVSGESNAPPTDCCTGFKLVLQKSPECICLLVKDRNDPSLGLQINSTRALSLPSRCNAPAKVSDCPALLHLAPNSPDRKVFDDFANSGKNSNATVPSPAVANSTSGRTTAAAQKSDGGKVRKNWLGTEMISGLLFTVAFLQLAH
ncbi:hypothetical protein ACJIZ3_017688 [Penstemon smallii]|uniref:Bifunctional inhibitor/plant lipid transfer protein/seed storage helical domain-containing protein n=1 Tax=Penstemon smallii TaxID=265156 RepID=A0ABD3SWU9_9LAMI